MNIYCRCLAEWCGLKAFIIWVERKMFKSGAAVTVDADTYSVLGKKGDFERIVFKYSLTSKELTQSFNLESSVNEREFLNEFDLANTQSEGKIQRILSMKLHPTYL